MNALFLDRDGTLNERLPGAYVRTWEEFRFLPGVLDALRILSGHFERIVIVTNQQGIGKEVMTVEELEAVHARMLQEIAHAGGRIDGVYFCPDLATVAGNCRKPGPAMALRAKTDFPEIDFSQSVMVGDSAEDIAFGHRLGMYTVLIEGKEEDAPRLERMQEQINARFHSLSAWAESLTQ